MQKFLINTALLFILIIIPVLPGYLHLFNKISNPPMIICTENGKYLKMNILKGKYSKLEALVTKTFDHKSDNDKTPVPIVLDRTINLFIYTLPSKISLFVTPFLINKLFYSRNIKQDSIYIGPSSPPPEFVFN